jgi:uncharacterized membrane protein
MLESEAEMDFEKTVEINAAPETVWQVLVDVERWPEWTDSITSVERLDTGPLSVGSRAKVKQPRLPATTWVVTELDPGRSFVWVAGGSAVSTAGDHVVTAADESGERSRVTVGISQHGPMAWLIRRAGAGVTNRYLDMEATGL